MRVQIVSQLPEDVNHTLVRNLLRRALKEIIIRRKTTFVNIDDITDADAIHWADILLQQVHETLRENPGDGMQIMNKAILNYIIGKLKA